MRYFIDNPLECMMMQVPCHSGILPRYRDVTEQTSSIKNFVNFSVPLYLMILQ